MAGRSRRLETPRGGAILTDGASIGVGGQSLQIGGTAWAELVFDEFPLDLSAGSAEVAEEH